MIPLCGHHTHHIAAWHGMPELGAVQINDRTAEDFEA